MDTVDTHPASPFTYTNPVRESHNCYRPASYTYNLKSNSPLLLRGLHSMQGHELHYLRAVESQRSNAQASTCSLAFSYYVPASELLLLLCLRHSPCPLPVKATLYLCDSSTRIPVLTPTSFIHPVFHYLPPPTLLGMPSFRTGHILTRSPGH
eukprot:COSAG02_NODE_1842_length_10700_cov_148.785869_6_plen_152_part_00